MNRLQPISLSAAFLVCFIAALAGGAIYFVVGMGHSTYLVSNGVTLTTHYLNKPRYDMQLQGLIFALVFLVAGVLLLLLIALPDQELRGGARGEGPPQPRRRPAPAPAEARPAPQAAPAPHAAPAAAAAPQPAAPQAAPQPPPQPAAAPAAPQPQAGHGPGSPLTIDAEEPEAQPAAPPPQPPPVPERPGVSVEEEVLQSAASADDLPNLDFGDNRFDDTGEEDVVYGTGRIQEDAVWDFVQQYPDSSVKFLYRKTLDNKPLSPTEEDIYRGWELRGMSRAKVREVVLEIMSWQSLPDNFPHEIWRELRDQIYEMKTELKQQR